MPFRLITLYGTTNKIGGGVATTGTVPVHFCKQPGCDVKAMTFCNSCGYLCVDSDHILPTARHAPWARVLEN